MPNKSMTSVTVAVTGASGSAYAVQLVKSLLEAGIKVNLLMSVAARVVFEMELQETLPGSEQAVKTFFLKYFSAHSEQLKMYGKEDRQKKTSSKLEVFK
jgi:4-hydroxy-3-polyprenylbenzoate decarboxylase